MSAQSSTNLTAAIPAQTPPVDQAAAALSGEGAGDVNLRQLLGNPKITFVLGGPASGKGTQCAKLVEEFGYTHISTGDLMRAEKDKGTRDGERIRKIMNEGGLVPFELTVQILINGLLANPSKNYLIDGFPRAVDQAIYFEQNVCECQNVLFYDVDEETLLERCMVRASNSAVQREDDNEETLKKRLRAFKELSKPVVDMYARFGKVKHIDASMSVSEVFEETKKAMLPQVFFVVGPKGSGKSTVARELAARTNMIVLSFDQFLSESGFSGDLDDEEVTLALVRRLVNETAPRVLIEDFPRTEVQVRLFIKNCVAPSQVFYVRCSKDACQERILEAGQTDPNYIPSSLLSKQIKRFHDHASTLLPYLRTATPFNEIDGEQPLPTVLKAVYSVVEPTVIHIRTGGNASSNELRKQIIDELTSERWGYANLDVNALIRDENERRTPIGQEFLSMVQSGKIIPAETIVRMLRRIIYSGDGRTKFILSSFPDIIDQAKEFERTCATISAIIYTTQDSSSTENAIVEIKNNNLTLFNIDALFQKEHRLKTMARWDDQKWSELVGGQKVDWSIVVGLPLQGKTTLLNIVAKHLGFKVVDWKQVEEGVKKTLGTEEEPYEGKVPLAKVEEAVIKMIEADRKNKTQYIFDSFPLHASADDFHRFTTHQMSCGAPDYVFDVRAGGVEPAMILARQKKRLEAEELNEEQQAEIRAQIDSWDGKVADYLNLIGQQIQTGRTRVVNTLKTDAASEETQARALRRLLKPRVILVNHEKRLGVDTTCANLAIKYNMIYLSAYQIIKQHIEEKTDFGRRLEATKKPKDIVLQTQTKDEFQEADYSAAHFDLDLVLSLLAHTVSQVRTPSQRFILLEGLCNSTRLATQDDRMELRLMDELFAIERALGEVQAVIGLQFNSEKEYVDEDEVEYERFEVATQQTPRQEAKGDGEGAEGGEQPPAEEGAAKKKAAFRPEDWQWTASDRKPRNLAQLFMQLKGALAKHEIRTAEQYSSSQYEAISKSLDEFSGKLMNLANLEANQGADTRYLYQQIIFSE